MPCDVVMLSSAPFNVVRETVTRLHKRYMTEIKEEELSIIYITVAVCQFTTFPFSAALKTNHEKLIISPAGFFTHRASSRRMYASVRPQPPPTDPRGLSPDPFGRVTNL